MKPENIEQISDQVIVVKWDDASEKIYFAQKVRSKCPCATCKDKEDKPQTSPFKILKANPNNVVFIGWEYVGRYALRFTFSDNHDTGIYTYEYLYSIGEEA